MPPIGKIQKKDWSIEEWLEESIDRRKKLLKRKGRLWDRSLKENTEIILSSSDESTATVIIPKASPGRYHKKPKDLTWTCQAEGKASNQEFASTNGIKVKVSGETGTGKSRNSPIGRENDMSQRSLANSLCIPRSQDHRGYDHHGEEHELQTSIPAKPNVKTGSRREAVRRGHPGAGRRIGT